MCIVTLNALELALSVMCGSPNVKHMNACECTIPCNRVRIGLHKIRLSGGFGSMIRTMCLLLCVHDTWLLHTFRGTCPSLYSYEIHEMRVLYDNTLCILVIDLLSKSFSGCRPTLRDELAYIKDTCFVCLS